jgi:hypothetical protein
MAARSPLLQLTWAGLDAAVDVIAAQCRWRDRAGVHGVDPAGQLLACALSERLGLNVLPLAGPGMIELHGLVTRPPASTWAWSDVELWAWVDATEQCTVQSVMKVTAGTRVLMPWQDAAAACARPFVAGFDD